MKLDIETPPCTCHGWNAHATWCLYGEWLADQMERARSRARKRMGQ